MAGTARLTSFPAFTTFMKIGRRLHSRLCRMLEPGSAIHPYLFGIIVKEPILLLKLNHAPWLDRWTACILGTDNMHAASRLFGCICASPLLQYRSQLSLMPHTLFYLWSFYPVIYFWIGYNPSFSRCSTFASVTRCFRPLTENH